MSFKTGKLFTSFGGHLSTFGGNQNFLLNKYSRNSRMLVISSSKCQYKLDAKFNQCEQTFSFDRLKIFDEIMFLYLKNNEFNLISMIVVPSKSENLKFDSLS